LAQTDLYQISVRDPDGLAIELNFFGLKSQADWGGENYAQMPKA